MRLGGLIFPLAVAASLLASAAPGEPALVKADSLTLREKADSEAKKLGALAQFDRIDVFKREKDWAQVKTKAGETGWVMAKYLTTNAYVSIEAESLNVRSGPGDTYDVIMKLQASYPLRVLDRAGDWLKISDFEGDRGWVSCKLAGFDPHVITKLDKCNVRTGPGETHPVAFTSEKGVVFKVLEEKEGWLQVQHKDGDKGWLSAKIVFGWLDVEDPKPKTVSEPAAKEKEDPPKAPAKKAASGKGTAKGKKK